MTSCRTKRGAGPGKPTVGVLIALFALLTTFGAEVNAATRVVLVSPGGSGEVVDAESVCPTLSWTEIPGAMAYELVVHEMGGPKAEPSVVLERTFPAGVSSWSPGPEECFAEGSLYGWAVLGRQPSETLWSEPALFRVRRDGQDRLQALAAQAEALLAERERLLQRADGLRASAESSRTERLGPMMAPPEVTVDGMVQATSLHGSGPGLVGVNAADVDCFGCVNGSDIGFGEVTAQKIAVEGVISADIQDGTLGPEHVASGAVQASHLADDELELFDFATGSVGASEVVIRSIKADVLAPQIRRVECNGECGDATLGDICGGAIAVFSPHGVPDPGGATSSCGGDNSCRVLATLSASTSLGDLCPDGGGWDCIVICG